MQAEASGAAKLNAEPTTVPSFDVVVIDPNGEGVIAGRAAPGWQVSVQSSGTKVATATADAQGEWSAVLDKPLPAGDHALSLKITSPDGTRAVSSQESVQVEVGDEGEESRRPCRHDLGHAARRRRRSRTAGQAGGTRCGTRSGRAARRSARGSGRHTGEQPKPPPKPTLVFKTVDYAGHRVRHRQRVGHRRQRTGSDHLGLLRRSSLSPPCAPERTARGASWSRRSSAPGNIISAPSASTPRRARPRRRRTVAPRASGAANRPRWWRPRRDASRPRFPELHRHPRAAVQSAQQKDVYTIRRGDTLWAIAKRYLGSGLRYTTIFQDNREVINDPDLILPQQQVKVPRAAVTRLAGRARRAYIDGDMGQRPVAALFAARAARRDRSDFTCKTGCRNREATPCFRHGRDI